MGLAADFRKTICFDLDGTICTNTYGEYERAVPFPWAVERVQALHRLGHRILIHTARGSSTGIDWGPTTRAQLDDWSVPYHELWFGKPSADVYVDDRAVHTTSWQAGDAAGVPGFATAAGDATLPSVALPHFSVVVESGRTYGGRALELDEHVARVTAAARAAGIPAGRGEPELAANARATLEAAAEDVVYTLTLAATPGAAFFDAWPTPPDGNAAFSVRPLRHVFAALRPCLDADGTAREWPLVERADGRIGDAAGGDLAAVRGGRLIIATPAHGLAGERLLALARGLGVAVDERPPVRDDVEEAEELLLAALPFCVLPLRRRGPVAAALLGAWSEWAGLDLERQAHELAGETVGA